MQSTSTTDGVSLRAWRKAMREALVAKRGAIQDADHARWSRSIHDHLAAGFEDVSSLTIAFCWPYQREFDARPLVGELLAGGAIAALPVVVGPKQPLLFRRWHAGAAMAAGVYGIPVPTDTPEVVPDVLLLPLNGFDAEGFRLGYGAGYFDRTLAALGPAATSIGIGFELARLPTIYPQPHDVALDFIVTERGVFETPWMDAGEAAPNRRLFFHGDSLHGRRS